MKMGHRAIKLVVILLPVVAAIGCGDSNLGSVTGTVKLDGAPLPNAMVTFLPQSGERPAAGMTDDEGRYELVFTRSAKGAVLGDHIVHISTFRELQSDDDVTTTPETVPSRYNSESELRANVVPGNNVFNFDLKSPAADAGPDTELPEGSPVTTEDSEDR